MKKLWDEDTRSRIPLKVVLLGSSVLLVQKRLSESLTGRFEVLHVPHWTFGEMKDAFGWSVEDSIFFGAYPCAAPFKVDEPRWRHYMTESLIETTLSQDILLLSRMDKPALLRRLFYLACEYSGRILSYHKMVGQLQNAGNTTILAHYLDILEGAGLAAGLQKYTLQSLRRRSSSPKLQVFNNALIPAVTKQTFHALRQNPDLWGRQIESAVGAHLINQAKTEHLELFYWNEGHKEIDFVLREGGKTVAFEVKSGRRNLSASGVDRFAAKFILIRSASSEPKESLSRISF